MILETVIPVFSIILVGFIIGKLKKIDIQPFVNLIVYISGPCLIISSISKSDLSLNDLFMVFIAASSIIIILSLITLLIFKIMKFKKRGLSLPMVIGNTGYLGYPVAFFAFAQAGLSRAIVFDVTSSLFLFSAGIYILQHKQGLKEVLKIPLIYAVVAGFLFNVMKISISDVIFKPIEMVGMITIPLALLILGYELTNIKVKSVKTAALASAFRIGGGILAALLIVEMFSITGLARKIIILQSSMPSAVMSMILTAKYKKDASLVASVVLITTVLSLVSIPLILHFLS